MGKNGTSKNRIGIFIGGALVVLAIITWVSIDGFPPKFMDTAGTIGAAKKYQVDQIKESDVVLEDQTIQALLQNDDFVRMVSDENFQAMPKDAKMQALTQNTKINHVMLDALMRYRDAEFVSRIKPEFGLNGSKALVLQDQVASARLASIIDRYLAAPEKWFEANKLAYRDVELAVRDVEVAAQMKLDAGWNGDPALVVDKIANARLASIIDRYLASPEKFFQDNKMAQLADAEFLARGVVDKISDAAFLSRIQIEANQ